MPSSIVSKRSAKTVAKLIEPRSSRWRRTNSMVNSFHGIEIRSDRLFPFADHRCRRAERDVIDAGFVEDSRADAVGVAGFVGPAGQQAARAGEQGEAVGHRHLNLVAPADLVRLEFVAEG